MKDRTKKTIKWSLAVLGAIILLLAITVVVSLIYAYGSIYEPIPFIERESSYVMPEVPESDIIPISDESEYYDDESDYDYSYEESENNSSSATSRASGGGGGSTKKPKETPIYIVEPIDKDILNILLVGRDVNETSGSHGRSDSMMLLSYNKKNGEVALTSFLRDTLVPIAGYGWNRLNAAHSFGGVGLSINTINEVFQLDIQHYVSIDFGGFIRSVDLIGGVMVRITKEEAAYLRDVFDLDIKAGDVKLNGDAALKFSRIRHLPGGDFSRTERQRRLLTAVIKQMFDLKNPVESVSMMNKCLKYVKTNLEAGTIASLINDFLSKDSADIETGAVPADKTYYMARYNGMSILKVDYEKNRKILFERIYGKE